METTSRGRLASADFGSKIVSEYCQGEFKILEAKGLVLSLMYMFDADTVIRTDIPIIC